MDLTDAIKLIEKGIPRKHEPQTWADLGAGDGLFSSALSALLAPKSRIYAVDSNRSVLSKIRLASADVELITLHENFASSALRIPELDGILMANSLHFVPNKSSALRSLRSKLKPDGKMVIIEYDMSTPNAWVPYPIPLHELKALLSKVGFPTVEKISEKPSIYNASVMYCVVAEVGNGRY
jgi:ubiquinone/menaquinone biosynthesis C-methylase UbiE